MGDAAKSAMSGIFSGGRRTKRSKRTRTKRSKRTRTRRFRKRSRQIQRIRRSRLTKRIRQERRQYIDGGGVLSDFTTRAYNAVPKGPYSPYAMGTSAASYAKENLASASRLAGNVQESVSNAAGTVQDRINKAAGTVQESVSKAAWAGLQAGVTA